MLKHYLKIFTLSALCAFGANAYGYSQDSQSQDTSLPLPRRAEMDFSEENVKPIESFKNLESIESIESKIDPAQAAAEQILSDILDTEIQNAAEILTEEIIK